MKTLIIGMGEVGRALCEVLRAPVKKVVHMEQIEDVGPADDYRSYEVPSAHEVKTYDKTDEKTLILFQPTDVLNICYPYNEKFVEQVSHYIDGCRPKLCIIHSTVPVGTTRRVQQEVKHYAAKQYTDVVHSPIHGQHPRLVEGIRTFTKYVGDCDVTHGAANHAMEFLKAAGINAVVVENAETSELSKLMCTAQTAMGILVQQEIHRLCEVYGADFREVYTAWNLHYNEGYRRLSDVSALDSAMAVPDYSRPIYTLKPGPLGGHCLFQNAALIDSWVTDCIRKHGGAK